MASVKIILRKEQKADGTFPLALRITKDRKSSYVYLNYAIKLSDWDEQAQRVRKTHPNSARLNNFLAKKLSEATDSALEAETKKSYVSAKAVSDTIKPKALSTFFNQAAEYLDNLKKSGKYNQYTSDKPRIAHFKEFLANADIAFADITSGLLEKFVVYLKSVHKFTKGKKSTTKKISDRTVANHLVVIRSVFAHARKNHVIAKQQSPFGEDGIKIKFPDTKKVGLAKEDVKALEEVTLADPRHDHARNLWLISFYFAGMRVSDVFRLRWSDFVDQRLYYAMGKNNKADSLKIPEKAIRILRHYEQSKEHANDLVFPELKGVDLNDEFITKRTIAFKTSAIDKILRLYVAPAAKIEKTLTMHISRHTFGGLAGDTIPIQMLQKLYRHSHVSTTIGYQQNFIHKDTDDALDSVLSYEPKKRYLRQKPRP